MKHAINKFEELSILGRQKRERLRELRNECNNFATQLVQGLRSYLGSPISAVYCVEVNREHRSIGQPMELPDLCYCYDTFWYFILGFDFRSTENGYKIALLVGIKKIENGFTVKLPTRDCRIDKQEKQMEFYEQLYNDIKENLSRPWTQVPKTFGFTMAE